MTQMHPLRPLIPSSDHGAPCVTRQLMVKQRQHSRAYKESENESVVVVDGASCENVIVDRPERST